MRIAVVLVARVLSLLALLAFVALVGCAAEATTGRDPASDEPSELIELGASWTANGGNEPTACEVVETGSAWRAMRVRLGDQPLARLAEPCDFAHERLIVVWMRAAAIEPPVTTKVTTEEGVDVVVLAPAIIGGAATATERTLVHVFVAPARAGQLAVVARLPQAGQSVESTVAVIAPR